MLCRSLDPTLGLMSTFVKRPFTSFFVFVSFEFFFEFVPFGTDFSSDFGHLDLWALGPFLFGSDFGHLGLWALGHLGLWALGSLYRIA